jgi:hypothetical protein
MACNDWHILFGSYWIFLANIFMGSQKSDFYESRAGNDKNWVKTTMLKSEWSSLTDAFMGTTQVIFLK